MVVKGSAAKRHRQSLKRRMRNKMIKSEVKTVVKKYLDAVNAKDKEKAEAGFKALVSTYDSAVTKGIFHRNAAARKTSRMHRLLNKIGS